MDIDITIDRLTPCLIERKTTKIFSTTIEQIIPSPVDYEGWNFDWSIPHENGYGVYALRLSGDNKTQGLVATKIEQNNRTVHIDIIETAPHNLGHYGKFKGVGGHLFAFACKQANDNGYDYIYFDSKTPLIKYYKKVLGAIQLGASQRMIIEDEAFINLLNAYYGGDKDG